MTNIPTQHMSPTSQWNVSYQLMWWCRTVRCIIQRGYKLVWMADKTERGDFNCNRDNTLQLYPYCHTQCADSRQVQHTKIHQFTGDRTANTKCGKQYRLQLHAFHILLFSRYSPGGADQLVLSTELTHSFISIQPWRLGLAGTRAQSCDRNGSGTLRPGHLSWE